MSITEKCLVQDIPPGYTYLSHYCKEHKVPYRKAYSRMQRGWVPYKRIKGSMLVDVNLPTSLFKGYIPRGAGATNFQFSELWSA